MRPGAQKVNARYTKRYGEGATYTACNDCNDFRDLCAQRPDIDAVLIATPNQWHALNAVEAARQGKDIYLEKPMARTVAEGQAIVKAVRRYGRILQVGSQQRSDSAFLQACEIARNGRIGTIREVFVNVGGPPGEDLLPEDPLPKGWIGTCGWSSPSGVRTVRRLRRRRRMTAGRRGGITGPMRRGAVADFGAHHFDIAQWGLGMDGTGPVKVSPPAKEGERLTYVYANGVRMYREGAKDDFAVEFVGDAGRVRVNRGRKKSIGAGPPVVRTLWSERCAAIQQHQPQEQLARCHPHAQGANICHRRWVLSTANVCHMGNIAYQLERPLGILRSRNL